MIKQKKNHQIKTIIATLLASIAFFSLVVVFQVQSDYFSHNILGKIQLLKYRLTEKSFSLDSNDIKETTNSFPVLVYHGIVNNPDRFSTTRELFFEQMSALKRAGYSTLTPEQVVDFLKNKTPIPEKSFLLTFDDGRKDSYYGADPILKFLDFKAVMFTATHQSLDRQSSDYYLTKGELSQMIKSNRWFIESHAKQQDGGFVYLDDKNTEGYFLSNRKWLLDSKRLETNEEYINRVQQELVDSKKQIESELGVGVSLFSYPFSDYGQESKNTKNTESLINKIISTTYSAGFRQIWPRDQEYLYNNIFDNPTLLKRFETPTTMSGEELVATFEAGRPKTLPFTEDFSSFYQWKKLWGDVHIDNSIKNLVLKGNEKANGAFTFLDGTSLWDDYVVSFKNRGDLEKSDLAIIARFKDTKHYVECLYSNNFISIQQIEGNQKKQIARSSQGYNFTLPGTVLSVGVVGDSIGCFVDNTLVVSSKGNFPKNGGPALSLWNGSQGSISFESIQAVPVDNIKDYTNNNKGYAQALVSDSEYTSASESYLHIPKYKDFDIKKVTDLASQIDKKWYIKSTKNKEPISITTVSVKYGANDSQTTVSTEDLAYKTKITKITGDSFAGWSSETQEVVPGQEFFVSTYYKSTAPAFLIAEFKMSDGSYVQQPIQWLVPSNNPIFVSGSVLVPNNAQTMEIMSILRTIGEMENSSIVINSLDSGAFDKGMITLNFDDGFKTSISEAYPILKKYHILATHFVISDYTSFYRYMDLNDLKTLKDAGHEIQNHTKTHKNLFLLSISDMQDEIGESKKVLQSQGFTTTAFNYPYGAVNNLVRAKVIENGFIGARSAIRGFNTKNTDPFMLKDQFVGEDVSFDEVKTLIDNAVTNKTWLILELHDVASKENANKDSVSPELLSKIASYIKSSGVKVVSISQGLQEMVK
jgi:peptidoglycan/xylan/chitin deacetylase (PgdA/CDA1 family)